METWIWVLITSVVAFLLLYLWNSRERRNFKGKIVLITGGGSGIGKLLAKRFAKDGSKIVIWDIRDDLLSATKKEIQKEFDVSVYTQVVDLAQKEYIYEAASKLKKEVGNVDVLVNNAGIVSGASFLECTDIQIEKTMQVNIMAHFWTVKSFLPDMIKNNYGHIITIASAAGTCGVAGLADYCASKFAAVGFDESLRQELRKKRINGVKTTVVCPFYINTGMFEGAKTKLPIMLPILQPEYVVNQIVSAAKREKAVLYLPKIVNCNGIFRGIMSTRMFDWLADVLGVSSSMDEFKGRGTDWALKELKKKTVK